jgi:cellulose synthase/poly-beta-1,6-N-acetylglucosamine synthase-like glycosyltransferase
VTSGAQDIVVNVIESTLARGYEVTKQEILMTTNKSYRVYVMIEVSKKEVEAIIEEINKKQVAMIDVNSINDAAESVLTK